MLNRLAGMKKYLLILVDILLVCTGYLLALVFVEPEEGGRNLNVVLANFYIASAVYVALLYLFGVYKSILRFSSIHEYSLCIAACGIAGGAMCLAKLAYPFLLPYGMHLLAAILTGGLTVFVRVLYRVILQNIFRRRQKAEFETFTKTLIIGAGEAANLIIRDIVSKRDNNLKLIGLIDDDPAKAGCSISGVRILGGRGEIGRVCTEKGVELILLAIPSLDGKNKKEMIEICRETKCKLKVLPGINDLIFSKPMVQNLREVDISDLLSRDAVKLDNTRLGGLLRGKTILVTGGGGSIGSELCRQIARFEPKLLVILDMYENNAYDLENELKFNYPSLAVKTVIASVRDRVRLDQVFARFLPDVVFHAAAHKHVPLMEDNPGEAIKNNVFGTLNAAECAGKYGVKKFILISTDKAVNPTNVMGATKRICEMVVQGINAVSKTDFALVRFGNVLGSNGSVIPLFKRQIAAGGPVTVTHKEITRFFMTIPEAAQLVLQAAGNARGGEIFVLDMGEPVKIYDLAENIIRLSGLTPGKDIEIQVTGLRPGEKLYEELLLAEEGLRNTEDEKIYIAKPLDISFAELKTRLQELSRVINEEDDWCVKETIHRIVPTYHIDYSGRECPEEALNA